MKTRLSIETFPNKAAADYIRGKAVADPKNFGELPNQLKQRAFVVAGIERLDAARRIRDAIAKLPEGANWDEVKKEIAKEVSPYVAGAEARQPEIGDARQPEIMKAARARAEHTLRIQGFQAYAVARHQQQMATVEIFPYWKYVTVGDSRVRAGHAALDGKVLRADDDWWKTHYPPWDWGCRCIVEALDEEDARKAGVSEHADMPTPERSETYSFDPTNIGIDLEKVHENKRFKDEADWKMFFVNPAKKVDVEAPDGRRMNMWQYSLEQTALKTAKTLSEGTNAIKARFETAAVISGKTGKRLSFALGNKSHTDIKIPEDEDAVVVHTHPSGSSVPSYTDLKTFLDIANGQEMFHYIAGVPHPKTGKPIRVRRVTVTGKLPDALHKEMEELSKEMESKDEAMRKLASIQMKALIGKIQESGYVEWEKEI